MQDASKNKLMELQAVITKMPLNIFCVAGLPEFGVKWSEVSRAVRNARLPMQPSSMARVLCRHVSKALTPDEIEDIVARLRLKSVATQTRTWHVVRLLDKTIDEPVTVTIRALPGRVTQALRKAKNRNMRPEIQTVLLGDLMYLSIQLVSDHKEGSILYVALPPGEPVMLASSLSTVGLLKACVEGLGYKRHEDAKLYGRDIHSLLRINDRANTAAADHLATIPNYDPQPVITASGIDYTNKVYDQHYVDSILGPNPPVLTELQIKTVKPFFDNTRLNKTIALNVSLKSENVAGTLKSWVLKGALAPTSDFFKIFHEIKSNKIDYCREDSD